MKTMNEILDTIRSAYFEKTGEQLEMFSPLGEAVKAAASELLSLYVYSDFLIRQAFPQTAEGNYLEDHAALRDISRKAAAASSGTLTFSLAQPSEEAVTVPMGTVCSAEGKPFVQFETTAAAVIEAGNTSVSVSAVATVPGADGNVPAGSITVMVNPPAGVYAVTNGEAFEGGCDAETDTALRARVLSSYRLPQTGYSEAAIREQLLDLETVRDCVVQFVEGSLKIYLRTSGEAPSTPLLQQIRSRLALIKVAPYILQVFHASRRPFSLTLIVETEREDSEIAVAAERAVRDYCASVPLGEDISLAKINCIVTSADGVKYCEAASPDALDGTIYGAPNRYYELTDLQVICHA